MLYPVELRAHDHLTEHALVGVEGFEPPTSSSQSWRSTRLSYTPSPAARLQLRAFEQTNLTWPHRTQSTRACAVAWRPARPRRPLAAVRGAGKTHALRIAGTARWVAACTRPYCMQSRHPEPLVHAPLRVTLDSRSGARGLPERVRSRARNARTRESRQPAAAVVDNPDAAA